MTMQSAKRVSLGAVMLERAAAILRMKALRLDLGWLREFDLPELNEACGRMEEELPGERLLWENIQRELIQNPAFARYLARLLPLLPEDASMEPPKPVYPAGRYSQPTIQVAPSRRSEMMCRLDGFVEACQGNRKDPAAYDLRDVVGILEIDELDGAGRLVYLENFAPMALTHEQKGLAINSLRQCVEVPIALTREQRDQLLEPYASVSSLFCKAAFGDVWGLLERCPVLRKILRLLYDRHIEENLCLAEYACIAEAPEEYLRGLTDLTERLSPNAAAKFLNHWQRDGCPVHALSQMVRRIGQHPDTDWENALQSYNGYVNLISGVKFRHLDFASVPQHLEDILLYAMAHKKTRFVRLVDEDPEAFLLLPRYSFLLQEQLYREHLNLNELTAKDLADCAWMRRPKLEAEHLAPGRRYTFPELRALYGLSKPYKEYEDAAYSGTRDDRPGFQLMLHEVEQLRPAYLILWKTDRLSRDRFDTVMAKSRLMECGVKIVYVAEPIPDDDEATQILVETINEGIAASFIAAHRKNVVRGMNFNAENALYNGIKILGYLGKPSQKYEIDEKTAPTVRRIFKEYAEGVPMQKICNSLNEAGLRTINGNAFTVNSIRHILTHRAYIGEYKFGDVTIEDGMPRIIDDETFQMAQKRLEANKRGGKGAIKKLHPDVQIEDYWLSGKLYCGLCGGTLQGLSGTGKGGGLYYYYSCMNHRKHTCSLKNQRKGLVENNSIVYSG